MKKKAYIQELETKVSTLSDHVRVLLAHSQQNGLPVPEYIESYLVRTKLSGLKSQKVEKKKG